MKTKICKNCKEKFEKPYYLSLKNWKIRKFCNQKCYSKWILKNRKAENHPRWKGGKHKEQGRWLIYVKNHPYSDNHNYIRYSRFIAEKYLKRYLTKIEIIHHINGIKDDDRPENLYLFTTKSEHTKYHWRIKKNVAERLMSNLI